MICLGFSNVEEFPFIDQPYLQGIQSSERFLYYMNLIDVNCFVTELGRFINKLPVVPEMGMTLVAAFDLKCLNKVAIIAACMEYQNIFLDVNPGSVDFDKMKKTKKAFNHKKDEFYSFQQIYERCVENKFSKEFLKTNF